MSTPKKKQESVMGSSSRECAVETCTRARYCRGYCTMHYNRYRTHGDPTYERPRALPQECNVDGCSRPGEVLGKTLCRMHYERLHYGRDLHAPVITRREARGQCTVPDCDSEDCGPHGYCVKHWGRVQRQGSPHVVIHQRDRMPKGDGHPRWTGDQATYSAVHLRLRHSRGPASEHQCYDCGGRASHWSYSHDDPNEKLDDRRIPYSTDLSHYVARCVPCHKRFDLRRLP